MTENQNCATGGPRISWFLVPKSNHEMRGSWIPRTVVSVKPQNGSKKFLKSTFWVFFSWNFDFFFDRGNLLPRSLGLLCCCSSGQLWKMTLIYNNLDQNGSRWIKLDQIGSNWIKLNQIDTFMIMINMDKHGFDKYGLINMVW